MGEEEAWNQTPGPSPETPFSRRSSISSDTRPQGWTHGRVLLRAGAGAAGKLRPLPAGEAFLRCFSFRLKETTFLSQDFSPQASSSESHKAQPPSSQLCPGLPAGSGSWAGWGLVPPMLRVQGEGSQPSPFPGTSLTLYLV